MGRKKLANPTVKITMSISAALCQAINQWASEQFDKPNAIQAATRLIIIGLKAETKARGPADG